MRRAVIAMIVLASASSVADPDRAAAHRERDACARALQAKQYEAAQAACERSITAWDGDPMAWYTLGAVQIARKDMHAAADAYEHAARLRPDEPMYLMWLGVARYEDAADQARHQLAQAIGAADPTTVVTDLSRANLDPARDALTQALAREPKLWRAHYYLGRIARDHADPRAAAEAFTRAILANPAHAASYVALGRIYLRAGYLDQAIQVAVQGTTNVPGAQDQLELWRLLGYARTLKHDDDRAIDAYTHILELDRADLESLVGRGLALARKGDRAGAKRDLELAVERAADKPEHAYLRAAARAALRALPP